MKNLLLGALIACAAGCSAKHYPKPRIWPPPSSLAPAPFAPVRWICWQEHDGDMQCIDEHGNRIA